MRLIFALISVAALVSGLKLAPLRKAVEKTSDRHIIVLERNLDVDDFARNFLDDGALFNQRPVIIRKLRTAINAVIVDMTDDMVELVRSLDGVQFVEEDTITYLDTEESLSIARVGSWGLDRINQRDLPLDSNDTMPMGVGANIYIIDTGIRVTHEDFKENGKSRAKHAARFVSEPDTDCYGHGTHCAGIAAGKKYGVAKGATVHAVKVMDCNGRGTASAMLSGIDFVAQEKVDGKDNVVASMSLSYNSLAFEAAVSAAIELGVVALTSSGNNNFDACRKTPGNIPEVITVGNTQSDDSIHRLSNFGDCVDILAPGSRIVSCGITSDTSTAMKSGTSMACPHVAGAAAILLADRGIAPKDVSSTLVGEATPDKITGTRRGTPNKLLYVRQ